MSVTPTKSAAEMDGDTYLELHGKDENITNHMHEMSKSSCSDKKCVNAEEIRRTGGKKPRIACSFTSPMNKPSRSLLYKKINLFSPSEDSALAHCVSEDFYMGKGIAVKLKYKFGQVDKLLAQNVRCGGCSYLKIGWRYVFYLVTKERYFQKPTYASLRRSLESMREICSNKGVISVAMPRIGCGLDRLNWLTVSTKFLQKFLDKQKF